MGNGALDPVAAVVAALRDGRPVLLPTDGVYGLCSLPDAVPAAALYALKGRTAARPAALIAASIEELFAGLPELAEGRSGALVRALLPGPYTLVLANPAERYPWLTGGRPAPIGVRVARLPPATQRVLDEVGLVAASSANLSGGPTPAALEDVPARLRASCGGELDGGRLSGVASTVLDLSGPTPVVIRAGAGSVEDALARVAAIVEPEGSTGA
jgi:tRNA threonylcarbamoyl adenosine modification protein (Sua5/YciO/YrdC/YwlC family)